MSIKTQGNLVHIARRAFQVEGIELAGPDLVKSSPLAGSPEVAERFTSLVRRRFGRDLCHGLGSLVTVGQMAGDLQVIRQTSIPSQREILRSNEAAALKTVILPGLHGCVHSLQGLLKIIPPDREVIGWEHAGMDESKAISMSITEMAERIARGEIRDQRRNPGRPIELLGYCIGGTIAHEVARLLVESGIEVTKLILIDSHPGRVMRERGLARKLKILGPIESAKSRLKGAIEHRLVGIGIGQLKALGHHPDHRVDIRLQLVRTGGELSFGPLEADTWSDLCRSVELFRIPDIGHVELFRGRHEDRLQPVLAA